MLLILWLAFQAFQAPIDDAYMIRLTPSYTPKSPGTCCYSQLRVLLVDRTNADRYWEIASIREEYEHTYAIKRVDATSVVIERSQPDYGIYQGSFKLFFDTRSKRLLKRIDFNALDALKAAGADELRRVGIEAAVFEEIRKIDRYGGADPPAAPAAFRGQMPPQSTYGEFARARPRRVQNGYSERTTTIEERIGPFQEVDGLIWFGKTFYDGEGLTGLGALGYFDIAQRKFTFLNIPEAVDWSVSALLVEDGVLWAGLELHSEGAGGSGGLLRHDLKTGATRIYNIDDSIRTIRRSGDTLVIGTIDGIYVLRDSRLIRHRVEPSMDGKFVWAGRT